MHVCKMSAEIDVVLSCLPFGGCAFRDMFIPHAGCDGHGPCMHGTCEQAPNGTYVCKCEEGWYGPECDVPGEGSEGGLPLIMHSHALSHGYKGLDTAQAIM